jgi:hypothetical protein
MQGFHFEFQAILSAKLSLALSLPLIVGWFYVCGFSLIVAAQNRSNKSLVTLNTVSRQLAQWRRQKSV